MNFYSPLRYPGGKERLANYLSQIIQLNGLSGGHYIEPFAGGAGAALALLFNGRVKHIHINDFDEGLFAFWHCVLNDTERFCNLISDTPVNIDEWYEQKYIRDNPGRFGLLKRGFSIFFLNRTNRSGVLGGGAIGGFSQSGVWKLDARYNKKNLIERIQKIATLSNRISLHNLDALDFLTNKIPAIKGKTLIYLDPPYYAKRYGHLYKNDYRHADHEDLAECVSKIVRQKWIISYDNTTPIKNIYADFKKKQYRLGYSASRVYKGTELMIYRHDLVAPWRVVPSRNHQI